VSKVAHCGINYASSTNLTTLREIPTRISQPLATAAAIVVHHDDNDARHQHQTPSSLSTVKENKNRSQRTSSSNAVEFIDDTEELDAIIARCQSWLQHRRPMPIASTDPNGAIQDALQLIPPPDTSSPWSSVTLASEDATHHILKNSQRLLDNMQHQSQALSHLVATSDELVALMTSVANVVNNLFSVQPPKFVLAHSPNPTAMTQSTITSIPAPVPETIKSPSPPIPATHAMTHPLGPLLHLHPSSNQPQN